LRSTGTAAAEVLFQYSRQVIDCQGEPDIAVSQTPCSTRLHPCPGRDEEYGAEPVCGRFFPDRL